MRKRNSTDRLTNNSLIYAERGLLYGCFVETDGTNNGTLTIYDSKTPSGKIIRKIIVPGFNYYGGFEIQDGIQCDNGIFATISGTGAAYWINYGSEL